MAIAPTHLGALYSRGAPIVFRRARALCGDEQWAREVVQAVFLRVLDRPSLVEEIGDPVSWLYRSTTRVCLERLRNAMRLEAEGQPRSVEPSGEGDAICVEIARVAASLPPPLDQVAIYAWLDGMRRAEIASVMRCSEESAGTLLRQARQTLVGQLERTEAIGER